MSLRKVKRAFKHPICFPNLHDVSTPFLFYVWYIIQVGCKKKKKKNRGEKSILKLKNKRGQIKLSMPFVSQALIRLIL